MTGYPFELTYYAMRNSNAITALTAQLMVILSGEPDNMAHIRALHIEFADCLPIIKSNYYGYISVLPTGATL